MKIKTRILSQVEKIASDLIETFDLYIESVDGKQLVKLECIDPEHANAIEKLISKCVNYVEDYAVLQEPEIKYPICPICKNQVHLKPTCSCNYGISYRKYGNNK